LLGRTIIGRIVQERNSMTHKRRIGISAWGRGKHRGPANDIFFFCKLVFVLNPEKVTDVCCS
jgi:hypothetical protein